MARFRNKKKWTSAIAGVLVLVMAVGLLAGLGSIGGSETATIGSSSFSVGGISQETGKGIDSNVSVYTKERIACQGLSIVPDFSSSSKYQLFFYNEDDVFVSATELRSDTFEASAIPAAGRYVRIVIYPSTVDENGKQIENFKVRFWNVRDIVKDFDITVSKTQTVANRAEGAMRVKFSDSLVLPPVVDLMVEGATFDKGARSWSGMSSVADCSVFVADVSSVSQIKLTVSSETFLTFFFVDSNGKLLFERPVLSGSPQIVDVKSASFVVVNLPENVEFSFSDYMSR